MVRTGGGLVILLAVACNKPASQSVTVGSGFEVSVRGKSLTVKPLTTFEQRRKAFAEHGKFSKDEGLLIGYAHDRYVHLFVLDPPSGKYRVDFLDAEGRVLETQPLHAGKRGINSTKEARFALVTWPETLTLLGVQSGDTVALSDSVRRLRPEQPTLKINGVPVYVELAVTYPERERGLMCRPRMSANDGMLFAYPDEGQRSFWMGGTLIPLSLAYIKSTGVISQFHDMETYRDPENPGSNYKTWPSKEAVQYVLEVNLDFFTKHGLKEGMPVELPAELKIYIPE
jgi:uncharacterized membrane protein (UPF0127 family)